MQNRNRFTRPQRLRRCLAGGVLTAALLLSSLAHALGLGQGRVNSYLNQPLEARIDLISRSEAEMATVTAGLASPADFQVMGLTRDEIAIPLEFTVNRDLADPHIRVTSRLPVNEPVVQLVVEVVWASGRMLRQYTLFLDPPSFPAPAPLPAQSRSELARQPVPDANAGPVAPAEPELERVPRPVSDTSPFVASEGETAPLPVTTVPAEPQADLPAASLADVEADRQADIWAESPAAEAPAAPTDQGPPFDPVTPPPAPLERPEPMAEQAPAAASEAERSAAIDAPVPEVPDASLEATEATQAAGNRADDISEVMAGNRRENPAEAEVDAMDDTGVPDEANAQPDELAAPGPATPTAPVLETADETAAADEVAQAPPAATTVDEDTPGAAADKVAETSSEPEQPEQPAVPPEPVEPIYRAVIPQASTGAPGSIAVERGDTLWGLSRSIAEQEGVAINQVMLAVQQQNPGAFLDNNINRLMAGEVLRIPRRDEMTRLSARAAMVEVLRQEALYRTRWDVPVNPDAIPTISEFAQTSADSAADAPAPGAAEPIEPTADTAPGETPAPADNPPSTTESGEAPATPAVESRLVLVPPSEPDGSGQVVLGQGTDGASEPSEGVSVVEELARTQEELANAQQENAYLEARINELEAVLQRQAAETATETGGVADNNLATMEERLREDRLSNEPEPEVDLVPGEPEPAFSWFRWWLLGGFVVLLGAAVLFLRSRRNPAVIPGGGTGGVDVQGNGDDDPDDEASTRLMTAIPEPDTEAVELPMDDPETQLNLARAYLAMGRKNRARELLELVIRDGTPEQEREAREMLREL